ncbi:MAG: TonB-dependent receptor [Gemmatimonadetes bacterium]|jgi:outer membrane receptor for ferrienterochelin and colicin|nr:TonB-dependent receptor [Gemmatimonadota bacterium]
MMGARICLVVVCALLWSVHTAVFAQPRTPGEEKTGDLHGLIVDEQSGEPLGGVNVVLQSTQLGHTTDRDGRFTIGNVHPGTYILQASCVGYRKIVREGVQIGSGEDLQLELSMVPSVFQLREVTVTPGSFSFMKGETSSPQIMSREDIKSVPQFGEDIFRAVNRLPGLSSGDYSAQFSIRGGRQDETLILIDGLEIYEPYHMKDFNEGAISIIDVETIEGVELMTGGFPTQYGNRRSGVFSITSRQPKGDSKRYSVGLSLMNARAMAEGSFDQGRGSWFLSARRGYLDIVFNLMNLNDLPAPVYYDVFSKVNYELNSRHDLSFHVLHAGDKFEIDDVATTGFRDTINTRETAKNKYGNSYVWTTLRSTLGSKLVVESMLSTGLVTKSRGGAEAFIDYPGGIYSVKNERDFGILGLKQDWMYEQTGSLFWEFGYDIRKLDTDFTVDNLVGQDPNDPSVDSLGYYPVETRSRVKKSGNLAGAYLSNRLRVLEPLTLELGLRYDRASHTKDSDFSPRANALIELGKRSHLRLGWGQYRQIHGIEEECLPEPGRSMFHTPSTPVGR